LGFFGVQFPSATEYIKGLGSVSAGNLPGSLSGGYDVSISSRVGYSASFSPFVFVHALPSTTDPSGCNVTFCNNQGTCPLVGLVCDCAPGFTGATCDTPVQYCQTDSCFNGGVCIENPLRTYDATLGMFANLISCDCNGTNQTATGGDYLGTFCEVPPPCQFNPCLQNGSVCTANATTFQFTCDCSGTKSPQSNNPYTGEHCEISGTRPCDLFPCQNGGTCTDTGPGSVAVCDCGPSQGFIGTNCELPPVTNCAAAPTLCGLYGVCVASSSVADGFTRCVCTQGWSGQLCDVEPSHCAGKCQNGGHCYALTALTPAGPHAETYSCLCPAPWVGMHCQWNETQWNGAPSTSVGLFAFMIMALIALF